MRTVKAFALSAALLAGGPLSHADTPAPEGPALNEKEAKKVEGEGAGRPTSVVSAQADALLKEMSAAYAKLESLELAGTLRLDVQEAQREGGRESAFTTLFQAPNRFRHESKDQPLLGSTGTKVYGYSALSNAYSQAEVKPEKAPLSELPREHGTMLAAQNLSLVLALSPDAGAELREMASQIDKVEDETIGEKAYPALKLTLREDGRTVTVLVDPETRLIRRTVTDLTPVLRKAGREDIRSARFTTDYATVTPGAAVKEGQFAWTPPNGAKDFAAIRAAMEEQGGDAEAAALVGKPAPDFTLQTLDGTAVSLSDLKGSVVLLDFWATWCGPCVAAMPHLDRMNEELSKEGPKVYAVNLKESKEKIEPFMKKHDLSLPVLLDKEGMAAKQFLVTGIPQTVVIGKDGLVKKVIVGFDAGGQEALHKLLVEQMKVKYEPVAGK